MINVRQRAVKQDEDSYLIDKVLHGEKHFYNQIIEKHKAYAFTIALNVLGNREDAEEVAHDSFIKAYKALGKFNKEAKFSTWLYRIVFNTAVSIKRKNKIYTEELDYASGVYSDDQSSNMENMDKKKFINAALLNLPELDRTILTLFYLRDHSLEEIADIIQMNFNNVKVRLHRARKKMAVEMQTILKGEALNL